MAGLTRISAATRTMLAVWTLCLAAAVYAPGVSAARGQTTATSSASTGARAANAEPDKASDSDGPSGRLGYARRLLHTGKYVAAEKGYKELLDVPDARVPAVAGLSRALGRQGQYADALEALNAAESFAADNAEWRLARAETLSVLGCYEDALVDAVRADELRRPWAPAILLCGRLLETLGRKNDALEVYNRVGDVLAAEGFSRDARALVAAGQILDRVGILKGLRASAQARNILHNYFQQAYQKVDARYYPANVAAGMFLLSKHRPKSALEEFELAERINPRLVEVHLARGIVALEHWNFEQCLFEADRALDINPRSADALVLKATCLMQWRKFEQVGPVLDRVLEFTPNHLEALSLYAALHERTGDGLASQEYIDRVGRINPRYAGLPNTIGEWLSAGRQYNRAEQHFLEAVELAPHLADPLANLGLLYMQTGEEARARDVLARAHELDDFRADVVNYSRVLERLESFDVRRSEHFVLKLNGEYDAVLADQMISYLENIYPELCSTFSHEPAGQVIVELFPTHEQFSVRITGKGWIGTVGACTGPVIVMVAPNAERSQFGAYNWATVLRHELTHAVTLSATGNRIPHWFTEACAVWQQPDRQSYDAIRQLVTAVQRDRLFPIRELDWGFIRPRRGGDRSLAYSQAEWAMEYIIATHGFDAVVEMLGCFRDGKTQTETLAEVLGVDEKEFDARFLAWARQEVVRWGFEPDPPPEVAKARLAVAVRPADAESQGVLALSLYWAGKADEAEAAARKALDLDADNADALGVLARILSGRKEYGEAIEMARRLEKVDRRSVIAPRVLSACYLARHEWAAAIGTLELLKQRRPMSPYSYDRLARIYMLLGRPVQALPNLIELHRRTMRDPQFARQIADIYRTMGENDKALRYYRQVAQINPYEVSAYKAMVEIHKYAGRLEQAVTAARWMTLAQPDSAEAWTYLGIARYHLGRTRDDGDQLAQARKAAARALELDPDAPQAHELIKLIDMAIQKQSSWPRRSTERDKDKRS